MESTRCRPLPSPEGRRCGRDEVALGWSEVGYKIAEMIK